MTEKLDGELSAEQKEELKRLILELKEINKGHPRVVPLKEIKMLPPLHNARLWRYFDHICRLVCMYPNHMKEIHRITEATHLPITDIVEEAVQEMIVWCYRYVWRNYNPSDDGKPEDIVYADANYGYMGWFNQYRMEASMNLNEDEFSDNTEYSEGVGRKVPKKYSD